MVEESGVPEITVPMTLSSWHCVSFWSEEEPRVQDEED